MKKKINSDNYYPLVSVAITTYNGTVFLRKQLDSIISQTYRNLEIVISDDGSNSTTIDILNEYAQKESRLRWSRSPLERGFVKNTQNSIALSKGEIIFLCDQDDVWYDNKIALHVEAYKDKSVAWVYNRLVLTDEDDTELGYLEDTIPNYYSK